jgi:hypothetical protein
MKQIAAYDTVIKALRDTLLSNEAFCSLPTWTNAGIPDVYPAFIDSMENPHYPSVTIYRDVGSTLAYHNNAQQAYYYIHGWIKPDATGAYSIAPSSAISQIMNLVIDALDLNPNISPYFAMCRLIDSKSPDYDETTRTTYFMTKWKIKYDKKILYI